MTPVLSPKKTWEGAAGAIVAAILVTVGIDRLGPALNGGLLAEIGFGPTVGTAGMLGDLAESLIKRDCQHKDASHDDAGLRRRAGCGRFDRLRGPGGVFVDNLLTRKRLTTMSNEASLTLTLESRDEALRLFGSRDQYLRLIRDGLGVRLVARGDTIQIDGPESRCSRPSAFFSSCGRCCGSRASSAPRTCAPCWKSFAAAASERDWAAKPGAGRTAADFVRPRTDGQGRYVRAMRDNDLIFCVGPGGTGKTYLAVGMAVSMLRQGLVKHIVLVRPAVEAGERLGFLPGDIVAKINPYLRPLFDALNDMMEPEQVKRYMDNDIIEIVPLAFMRGRTLNHAVIILDEGQNTTVPQMKMFLTRMGHGSKIIVTGDVTQVDLPKQTRSGLIDAVHRLRNLERIAIVYLDEHDIVRHPLVQQIVRAYEEEKPRKRKE